MKFRYFKLSNSAFTLIELILVLAVFAVLVGAAVPLYQRWQTTNDIDVATITLASTLRRGQLLSQSMAGDSLWGVYVGNKIILLFQGNSSTTRNVDFDEVYNLPNSINTSIQYEVVFSKLTGQPSGDLSIILNSDINENREISINSQGVISY